MSVTIRSRNDCNTLPGKGWQREEVLRTGGISAGKVDIYYYSPTGKKIMSKHQLARYLGESFDISSFDFQTGKMMQCSMPPPSITLFRCSPPAVSSTSANSSGNNSNSGFNVPTCSLSVKRKTTKSQFGPNTANITLTPVPAPSSSYATTPPSNSRQQQQNDYSRALRPDLSLVPPIRQTASIFKQPVTVIRNHNGKIKQDPKHTGQEKPKQLFWEKRLENLRACEEYIDVRLPKTIRAIGPNVNEHTVLQSVASACFMLNGPITGQTAKRTEFNTNPTAYINSEQPLMEGVLISDDDIQQQEEKVNAARRKLQDALKS